MKPLILYSSYSEKDCLPSYVVFVLRQLSSLGDLKLLTNRRSLSKESLDFLIENHIELFLTENYGYDFGMWSRYLKANPLKESCRRLVLINDSIVYYKNCLKHFFEQAESKNAEAVGLLQNADKINHLQSFFLYLKDDAVNVFEKHLNETKPSENFEETIQYFEIPFSEKLLHAKLKFLPLFETMEDPIFCYPQLILSQAGFVKKRLLERRFSFETQKHFLLHGKSKELFLNYRRLILKKGNPDKEFTSCDFPGFSKNLIYRICERLRSIGYCFLAFFYFRLKKKFSKAT